MVNIKSIFWHRRDLRINDNAGLYNALKNCHSVQPIFIFDSTILSQLPNDDQRIIFIHQYIVKLKKSYNDLGADLLVYFGNPIDLIPQIVSDLKSEKVYTNRDYEPSAIERDKKMAALKQFIKKPELVKAFKERDVKIDTGDLIG